ncbi:hypothetical protein M8C21_028170, partial [Ambrosia artemisiifolia]
MELWKAAGMNLKGGQVEFLWSSKEINNRAHEYWPMVMVMDIARRNKLPRIVRCGQAMDRNKRDELTAAQIFYRCMQWAASDHPYPPILPCHDNQVPDP